jgi:hypothetical protein
MTGPHLQRAAAHVITGIGKAVAAEHVSQQIQIAARSSIIRGGHCHNTTENFIAEKDGKFVIPVPGPCK